MTGATTFQSPNLHRLPATLPLDEIVGRLNALQPSILRGYPTALAALAAEASAGRLRIAPLAVRAHSEPLLPEVRRSLEDAWGRPPLNAYGTTEGACGAACGAGEGLHLNDDLCVFELVDEVGRPVPPGERSAKVYITNLMNVTQPLIRYELSDEMRVIAEPCPCGSALLRVADIEGRSDDCFTYPTAHVHPLVFRSVLGREPGIIDYQVRQTARGADVHVRTVGAVDMRRLVDALASALTGSGLDAPVVTVKEVETFEQLVTGKVRRFFPLTRESERVPQSGG